MIFETVQCRKGERLPLLPANMEMNIRAHRIDGINNFFQYPEYFKAGMLLKNIHGEDIFQICGFNWLSPENTDTDSSPHMFRYPQVRACADLQGGEIIKEDLVKTGYSVAVITLSDKGALGLRSDKSGPAVLQMLKSACDMAWSQLYMIPDDARLLKSLLADLSGNQGYDLVCTSGGTGAGLRDITPQVTASLLDYEFPGFAQAMMQKSLVKTPHAMLSRSVAGVMGKCLIINLPGSLKGATENLEAVLPALNHVLAKLGGDENDCGND